MAEIIRTPQVEVELKSGNVFSFGKMFWRILEVNKEQQTMLVITDREVCEKKYNDKYVNTTWEDCTLRKWLNEEYLNTVFSKEEQDAILTTHLTNPDNPSYGTKGGNDTEDKIYLLSIDEAYQYFKDARDRSTGNSWWLRSPGYGSKDGAVVRNDGGVDSTGDDVTVRYFIRPALNLNLQSEIIHSKIQEQDGSLMIRTAQIVIEETKLIKADTRAKEISVPEGVTEITSHAFDCCEMLETINISSSLSTIGNEALADELILK